jgi:hypothetical protein
MYSHRGGGARCRVLLLAGPWHYAGGTVRALESDSLARRLARWLLVSLVVGFVVVGVHVAEAVADVPTGTEADKPLTYGQASEVAQEAAIFVVGGISGVVVMWLVWQALKP